MQETQRQQYLQAMGIQLWESTAQIMPTVSEVVEPQQVEEVPAVVIPQNVDPVPVVEIVELPDWDSVQKQVEACRSCGLHENRIYPVFGAGDKQARIMFIGDAPGAEEDRNGDVFIGAGGQLLTEMLFAIGFKRSQVYLTNMLKCRPPSNRAPAVHELQCCDNHLQHQIRLVAPDVIVALGPVAAQGLLHSDSSLDELRLGQHCFADSEIPIIVTCHPDDLLITPADKRKAWGDLQKLMSILN